MSENIIRERVLALAGIAQAVKLVKQVATKGYAQETELKTCLFSIIQTESQSTEQIYGATNNLRFGLQELRSILDVKQKNKDSDIVRYLLSILHLEKQLSKHGELLDIIQSGITDVKAQLQETTELASQEIIATLATIYQKSLSTLKFKIHVSGNALYLTNFENISKVRALLLAAVRSAVLWRQLGGSKWQLIFNKKDLLAEANYLLNS